MTTKPLKITLILDVKSAEDLQEGTYHVELTHPLMQGCLHSTSVTKAEGVEFLKSLDDNVLSSLWTTSSVVGEILNGKHKEGQECS